MQQVLGYSALQTGLAFLPHALAAMIAGPLASQLVSRLGVKLTLVLGIVAAMVGLLLLTGISVPASFVRDLLPGTVIVGLGIGSAIRLAILVAVATARTQAIALSTGVIHSFPFSMSLLLNALVFGVKLMLTSLGYNSRFQLDEV